MGFPQWWRICLLFQELWIQSLDQEDSLEKEMAIHSSMLAWEIPWTEEPGRLQSMGLQESDMTAAKQQQQRFVLGASEKQNEQDV